MAGQVKQESNAPTLEAVFELEAFTQSTGDHDLNISFRDPMTLADNIKPVLGDEIAQFQRSGVLKQTRTLAVGVSSACREFGAYTTLDKAPPESNNKASPGPIGPHRWGACLS